MFMSNFNVTVNDSKVYELSTWNSNSFSRNYKLKLITSDFDSVKTDFTTITKVEIKQEEEIVASYTMFDSYSNISYIGKEYVASKNEFVDIIEVVLNKTDLIEQVNRLDATINPVIDVESMSVIDYKNYVLSNVSADCQADIFKGDNVEISSGTKLFTFTLEDQNNLTNAMSVITQSPDIETFPFHASGEECTMFPVSDIVTIYLTLQMRLTKLTTYCNMLNMYIRSLNDKDELAKITYGMDLPEEYQTKMDAIVEQSNTIVAGLAEKFLPNTETDEETSESPVSE